MNSTQQIIISLVKSAIESKPCGDLPNDTNWKQIFKLCQKAQITPLIFETIEKNQCGAPEEIRALFQQSALYQVVLDQQQQYQLEQLTEAFNTAGIDFALLKGSSLKPLYPSSLYRTMCDIDILIKEEQYPQIREIMLSLSYAEKAESDHEYIWQYPPHIHIELHKRLIPSYNEDFFAYYGSGWHLMENCRQHQYRLTPENELIYLLAHFAKHYRDGGIGIRHIVDLWVFKKHHSDLDENYILADLKKLRLDKFYRNVLDTINVWFDDKAQTEATELITNTVFQSGSYGNRERAERSNALRLSKKHHNIFLARMRYLYFLVFLPKAMMRNKYPILKKRPYLLPVFWVVRWFEALLFKKDRIRRQGKQAKNISQDTAAQYREELNAVGLDYYF